MLIQDAIANAANVAPDRPAVRFLANGEEVTDTVSYQMLHDRSAQKAAWIAEQGWVGQPVALVFDAGIEFVETLLACLMAGAIAVPLPTPRQHRSTARLQSSLADVQAVAILTTSDIAKLPALADRPEGLHLISDMHGMTHTGRLPAPDPDSPAVIQYSSGSTAKPRGIVITHNNTAANLTMMTDAMGVRPGDASVAWLPHTHDMGLFGTILAPLFSGILAVLMPPNAFLRRPMRWLTAISMHRASHSTAPNFGYALAARRAKPDDISKLDLSNWRIACIGSEPTLPETLVSFTTATGPAGFDPDAFQSCYGLAEATLLCATGQPKRDGSPISCGRPVNGCKIRLRGGAETGEIMIAGAHASPGLWAPNTEHRVIPFDGSETERSGEVFIPTGDLGRFDNGEVFILDRLKDLLPIRGGTLGPVEVERLVCNQSPLIEAAAAVPDDQPGSYRVRIAVELNARRITHAERQSIRNGVSDALARDFGIQTHIRFFAPHSLPRTTSGKIQRYVVRDLFSLPEDVHADT